MRVSVNPWVLMPLRTLQTDFNLRRNRSTGASEEWTKKPGIGIIKLVCTISTMFRRDTCLPASWHAKISVLHPRIVRPSKGWALCSVMCSNDRSGLVAPDLPRGVNMISIACHMSGLPNLHWNKAEFLNPKCFASLRKRSVGNDPYIVTNKLAKWERWVVAFEPWHPCRDGELSGNQRSGRDTARRDGSNCRWDMQMQNRAQCLYPHSIAIGMWVNGPPSTICKRFSHIICHAFRFNGMSRGSALTHQLA